MSAPRTLAITTTPDRAAVSKKLSEVTPDRLRVIAQAMRHGFTNDDIQAITAFDPWFLSRIREIVAFALPN